MPSRIASLGLAHCLVRFERRLCRRNPRGGFLKGGQRPPLIEVLAVQNDRRAPHDAPSVSECPRVSRRSDSRTAWSASSAGFAGATLAGGFSKGGSAPL